MTLGAIVALGLDAQDLEPPDWAALAALGGPVLRTALGDPSLDRHLAGADALIVPLGLPVDRRLLERAPLLRYVGVLGTSLGRVDLEAARARGIEVRNVPGASTDAVAELAIALAIAHLRDLPGAWDKARAGELAEPAVPGRELRSSRLGVVGLGAIGRRVAEIARRGFGTTVAAWSRTARPELDVEALPLEALLARSDVVSVHLALAPETRGLLDATRIARLRPHALLIHLAPLELLDLDALLGRLRDGTLSFVTDHGDELGPEPLAALRAVSPASLLPPIGYATREARAARRRGLLAGLEALAART